MPKYTWILGKIYHIFLNRKNGLEKILMFINLVHFNRLLLFFLLYPLAKQVGYKVHLEK